MLFVLLHFQLEIRIPQEVSMNQDTPQVPKVIEY